MNMSTLAFLQRKYKGCSLKFGAAMLRPFMTKVLVSDPIDQAGIDILSQVAQVDQRRSGEITPVFPRRI